MQRKTYFKNIVKISGPLCTLITIFDLDLAAVFQVGRAAYHSKPVLEWEVEEVCQWLEDIGLAEHCPQFQENEILGEHLLELTKDELAELGVKKIGHKKTFLAKVKELTSESST